MKYSKEMRETMIKEAKGLVIESLEWDEVDEYWTFNFTNGSTTSFRFMTEL